MLTLHEPWFYNNRKTGGERLNKTKFGGGAQKHYPLVKDKDLIEFGSQVQSITADNCALFLWATAPKLPVCIEFLKSCGFRYATTAYTWIKTNNANDAVKYGTGNYTASNPEFVLLGVKGSMPVSKKMTPSVIIQPRMEHSRKPDIHHRIDELYPKGRRIELFARRKELEGWDYWGNEV